jgi:hypothetical protein
VANKGGYSNNVNQSTEQYRSLPKSDENKKTDKYTNLMLFGIT